MLACKSDSLFTRAAKQAKDCIVAAHKADLKHGMISLNLVREYLQGRWNASHGVRELVQNYLDGLASLLNAIGIEKPLISHVCVKEAENSLHIVSYYRCEKCRESFAIHDQADANESNCLELGYLYIERSAKTNKCRMELVNRFTCLTTNVLRLGKTDKKGDDDFSSYYKSQAGGFGEGLKVGILSLLRENVNVCYFTASAKWEFKFREAGEDKILYVHTRKHKDTKTVLSSRDTRVLLTWKSEDLSIFDRSVFPSLTDSFINAEKRSMSVLPLIRDLHFSDTSNSFLLFGETHEGTVYVSLIRVCQRSDFLVGVGFSCPELHAYLGRDRNQIPHYAIERYFGPYVTGVLGRRAISNEHAVRIYDIVESLDNANETVWNSLLLYDSNDKWTDIFAEQFRKKYGKDAYPCGSVSDMALVVQNLGRNAVLVSRCLYDILVLKPCRSGYLPLEESIKEAFVKSPVVPIEENLLRKIDLFARATFAEISTAQRKPAKQFVIAHSTKSKRLVFLHSEEADADLNGGSDENRTLSLRLSSRVLDAYYTRVRKDAILQRQQQHDSTSNRRFPPLVQLLYSILSSILTSGSPFINDSLSDNARLRLTERMYDLASDCFRDESYYASLSALDLQEDVGCENDNDGGKETECVSSDLCDSKKRKRETASEECADNMSDCVDFGKSEESDDICLSTQKHSQTLYCFKQSTVLNGLTSVDENTSAPQLDTCFSNNNDKQSHKEEQKLVKDNQKMHTLRAPLVACTGLSNGETAVFSVDRVCFFQFNDVEMTKDWFDCMHKFAVTLRAMLDSVFNMQQYSVGVFWAPDSGVCALNRDGAIFYNAALHTTLFDIFLSTCHELSHNVYKQHDWKFVSIIEQCVSSFICNYNSFVENQYRIDIK